MNITQDFKCAIGLHKCVIEERQPIRNPYDIIIGTTIITKCTNCGKIKEFSYYTDSNYRRIL